MCYLHILPAIEANVYLFPSFRMVQNFPPVRKPPNNIQGFNIDQSSPSVPCQVTIWLADWLAKWISNWRHQLHLTCPGDYSILFNQLTIRIDGVHPTHYSIRILREFLAVRSTLDGSKHNQFSTQIGEIERPSLVHGSIRYRYSRILPHSVR